MDTTEAEELVVAQANGEAEGQANGERNRMDYKKDDIDACDRMNIHIVPCKTYIKP